MKLVGIPVLFFQQLSSLVIQQASTYLQRDSFSLRYLHPHLSPLFSPFTFVMPNNKRKSLNTNCLFQYSDQLISLFIIHEYCIPVKYPVSRQWLTKRLTFYLPETKTAEFANSVDLDEVARNEPPHLDLHCLPISL